jgi:hypothetical protein
LQLDESDFDSLKDSIGDLERSVEDILPQLGFLVSLAVRGLVGRRVRCEFWSRADGAATKGGFEGGDGTVMAARGAHVDVKLDDGRAVTRYALNLELL